MPRIFWLISTLSLLTGPVALAQLPAPSVEEPLLEFTLPEAEPPVLEVSLPLAEPTTMKDATATLPPPAVQKGTVTPYVPPPPLPQAGVGSMEPAVNHATQYVAAPDSYVHGDVGCANCALAARRPCNLKAVCEWLCFRELHCNACKNGYHQPTCQPNHYEYFLPCAGGSAPYAPSCAGCAVQH